MQRTKLLQILLTSTFYETRVVQYILRFILQNYLDMKCNFSLIFLGTFEDKEITHVEGEVDPVRDLDIINEELRLKDEEAFLKNFDDLEKKYQRGEKKLKQEYVSYAAAMYLHLRTHSVEISQVFYHSDFT